MKVKLDILPIDIYFNRNMIYLHFQKCECSETVVSTLLRTMPEMRGPPGERGYTGVEGPRGLTGPTVNIPQFNCTPSYTRAMMKNGDNDDDDKKPISCSIPPTICFS